MVVIIAVPPHKQKQWLAPVQLYRVRTEIKKRIWFQIHQVGMYPDRLSALKNDAVNGTNFHGYLYRGSKNSIE